jgi:IS1 family transposase
MPSSGVVYNTDSATTTVLLRHFVAMIETQACERYNSAIRMYIGINI